MVVRVTAPHLQTRWVHACASNPGVSRRWRPDGCWIQGGNGLRGGSL